VDDGLKGATLPGRDETLIRRLVEKLDSLLEGEEAAVALVACGQRAVEHLREFLMEGQPRGIYQPRRWAVEALAGLEAKDVLLEYLRRQRPILDAVVRMGEEAVQNAAAMALRQWPGEDVYELLTGIVQHCHLPGAVATLGELGCTKAIPYIVAALEDGVCRPTAEEALRKLGEAAVQELILAALNPWPDRDKESPSSLLRRGSAARLLAEIGVSEEQWIGLRSLIHETDPAILIAAGRISVQVGDEKSKRTISGRLIAAMNDADWYFREEIGEVLVLIYDVAQPMVELEIAKRKMRSLEDLVFDAVLHTLLRVKRRAEEEKRVHLERLVPAR